MNFKSLRKFQLYVVSLTIFAFVMIAGISQCDIWSGFGNDATALNSEGDIYKIVKWINSFPFNRAST